MTYFELFDIPVSFSPDKTLVKKKFYELSRKFHPDFFSNASQEEKANALETSSLINKAYKTFFNKNALIQYVLMQKGLLETEEKYSLPQNFLMAMLEFNEELGEAKMEDDKQKIAALKIRLFETEKEMYEDVKEIIENYPQHFSSEKELLQVKEYYFKKKYLDRILEGLQ